MEPSEPTFATAKLKDIPLSSLGEQFIDRLAKNSRTCDVEWGTRRDDHALVFHFFPPGYALDASRDWPSWEGFRDKLEQAALKHYRLDTIDAGYVRELKSFFLILQPRPAILDLQGLIERFLSELEL